MAEDIEVRIVATTSALDSGMGRARAVVEQATSQMRQRFGAMASETGAVMSDLQQRITSTVRGMAGSFGGLVDVIATTRGGLVALGAAAGLIGGAKAVSATANMTESAMDLGRALGISTQEARVYLAALDDVGAQSSEFEAASKGLARALREDEPALNSLGLVTRDAAGDLRPLNDLVLDGIDVLGSYREGADRAVVSQQMFGRGLDGSSKLMMLNRQVIEENRVAVKELGLQTGDTAVAAWSAYDAATDRARLGMQGMTKAVGDSLMPVMTDLVGLFNAVMPAAISIVRAALSSLTAGFLFVKNGVVVLWETINAFVVSVAEPIRALGEAVGRALVGDFSGAAAQISGIAPTIANAWGSAFDRMSAMSAETASKVAALFGSDAGAGDTGGARGTKAAPRQPAAAGGGRGDRGGTQASDMPAFESGLAALRAVAAEQDALHGLSQQAEADYWQSILQGATLSEADRTAVAAKARDARIDVLRDEARQQQQLQQISIEAWEERAIASVDLDAEAARQRVAIGQMTQVEMLQQEMAFEDRRLEIKRAALESARSALDPERDPVQIAQTDAQIEALLQQHEMRKAQIRGQIAASSADDQSAIWQDLQSRIGSLWDDGVQAMMNGTLTWRNAMRAIGSEMVAWFAGVVRSQVSQWLLGESAKTGATSTGTALRAGMETLAAARSVATWAAAAVKNIMASAWEAMAAAWKAMAGIPVIGPALAVAAAGATFAGVAALAGRVASAEGGYDIPAGVNPMTQLHEREMVLPARHADVIRDLAESRGSAGAGAGAGAPMMIRARSMDDLVSVRDLAQAARKARRDFIITRRDAR